ncbi:hypothetical protein EYF80_045495 [Liparis tanakae]|uniref:Uncharacterized protein n=1 Tax=Liparis tanakae TaxID=230148 RepID=A0A4Z2FSW3_9TELE|nr:hypothetical protein EYF80_045495 [Liparis tanakae]
MKARYAELKMECDVKGLKSQFPLIGCCSEETVTETGKYKVCEYVDEPGHERQDSETRLRDKTQRQDSETRLRDKTQRQDSETRLRDKTLNRAATLTHDQCGPTLPSSVHLL